MCYNNLLQPTPPPLGYRSVGEEREKKTCEPDPFVAPIIKELFELYATGSYSILEIQDWLEEKNLISKSGTLLSHSVINTVLKNPFYYGLIRWYGEAKIGKHKAIITKELYETCQYVLGKHRNFLVRKRVHDFLLRGFLYCNNCGQRYTAEWHKDENKLQNRGGKIAYYHCQKRGRNGCKAPYVEMSEIEYLVEQEFKTLEFSEEFIQTVVNQTRKLIGQAHDDAASHMQGILNQKTGLEMRRKNLLSLMLDGVIDRNAYQQENNEIQDKIMKLDNQIINADEKSKIDLDLIEEVLAFTRNIHQTYLDAPQFMKRYYLRFFFEKLVVKDKKIYEVIPTPIFKTLVENNQVIIRTLQLRD